MAKDRTYKTAGGQVLPSGADNASGLDARIRELLAHTSQEDKKKFISYFEAVLKKQP